MATQYNEKMVNEILDAAYDLFVEQGYDSTSIIQISEAVNISKSGLFYYFPDKQSILETVLSRKAEVVNLIIKTAVSHEDCLERLIDVLVDMLFEQKKEAQFYNNVFSNNQLMETLAEERKSTIEQRMIWMTAAFKKQQIPQPELAVMTLISMVDGMSKIVNNNLYELDIEGLKKYIKSLYSVTKQ